MSQRPLFKINFNVCYYFLDIYENPKRKNFINSSCLKHPKIINWNQKLHKFLFLHFFVGYLKKVSSFDAVKRSVKINNLCQFPPLFQIDTTRVKRLCVFVKLLTSAISVFLSIEMHEKQCWHLSGVQRQNHCKPMPSMVSNGLETCILIPFSLLLSIIVD